jgi:hypothetical protein
MSAKPASVEETPVEFAELMEIEQQIAGEYSTKASLASDPHVRSLFSRLAEMHTRCYAELKARNQEVQSQNEITLQINAMFL